MAAKYKLTRPELKRYRDALARFERYLPMLKLKQQQLQIAMRKITQQRRDAQKATRSAQDVFEPYSHILSDIAGVNVSELAQPKEVKTKRENIAGLDIPVFEDVIFPPANYSLFATPAWIDHALRDLREISRCRTKEQILEQQFQLLEKELTKISQRVNLFEKVKIPEAREVIRVIRIKLGDEMTAAVGRAKIAKSKLSVKEVPVEIDLPVAEREGLY